MKDANKPFVLYMGLAVIFGIISGLCMKLQYNGAAGIFTSITSVLLILGLPWGVYSNPLNVRKRNFWRILMFFSLFHMFFFLVMGTSEATVTALNVNHAEKEMETVSKSYSIFTEGKKIVVSILKFESVDFGDFRWVYLAFIAGVCIPVCKYLSSWGFGVLITFPVAIGFGIVCWYLYQNFKPCHWHSLFVFSFVVTCLIGIGFMVKNWKVPACT